VERPLPFSNNGACFDDRIREGTRAELMHLGLQSRSGVLNCLGQGVHSRRCLSGSVTEIFLDSNPTYSGHPNHRNVTKGLARKAIRMLLTKYRHYTSSAIQ